MKLSDSLEIELLAKDENCRVLDFHLFFSEKSGNPDNFSNFAHIQFFKVANFLSFFSQKN